MLSLAGDLEPMVNNEQFSDVAFLVEGRTVHAHKFILFARCEYFRRMFTGGYKARTAAGQLAIGATGAAGQPRRS